MEKSIPHMSLPRNLKGRSSWSKMFQLYLKNYDFFEYVKCEIWGNFVKKNDILSVAAYLKFESNNPLAHM